MTAPDNPRFTTVIANRLWKLAFGLAIIEPLDDISDINSPVNPELMKRLEALVKETGYDMKAVLRVIFNTRAYQAAATKQEIVAGTPYHFTGPVLRRMSAEQMWDSFVTLINAAPYATPEDCHGEPTQPNREGGQAHRRARSADAGGGAARREGRGRIVPRRGRDGDQGAAEDRGGQGGRRHENRRDDS